LINTTNRNEADAPQKIKFKKPTNPLALATDQIPILSRGISTPRLRLRKHADTTGG
jgi:hypothetical protein